MFAGAAAIWEAVDMTNLMGLVIAIVAAAVAFAIVRTRQEGHTLRLTAIDLKLDKIGEILVLQARHDERINTMDERIASQGKRVDETVRRINMIIDGEYVVPGKMDN